MKKILTVLITVVILSSLICVVCQGLDFTKKEGKTEVDVRLVVHENYVTKSYYITVFVDRYEKPEDAYNKDASPIGWGDFDTKTPYYEGTIWLEPGYYKFSANGNDLHLSHRGETEVFEVKGDKMVVYCPIENERDRVIMPKNQIVYGEDEQTWQRWVITAPEKTDEPQTESVITDTPETVTDADITMDEPEPPDDTDVYVDEQTQNDTISVDSAEQKTQKKTSGLSSSQIGSLVFSGFLILVIAGTLIAYFVIKNKRES